VSYVGSYENAIHVTLAHWDLWWYEHPGLLWDRSPVAHVHRNWAPLHIDHGLLDTDVPVLQSKELYQALQLAGAKTRLVLYPREDHVYVEEAHQIEVMTRYLQWLDVQLGRDSTQRK
jgi:dipeptidyl aminopeptidase/acylaminoacyl peptidase